MDLIGIGKADALVPRAQGSSELQVMLIVSSFRHDLHLVELQGQERLFFSAFFFIVDIVYTVVTNGYRT